MQTKRLFIALDMPSSFIEPLQEVQKQILSSGSIEGRAVLAEQIHLTLQFLGAVPIERMPMIVDALNKVQCAAFTVHLDGLFALPNEQEPRVIAIDVVAPELIPLVESIRRALRPVTTLDERDFLPHVTLVRVKKVIDQQKLHDTLATLHVTQVTAPVNEFILRESMLSSEGAMHSDVKKYQLSPQQQIQIT